jgi:ATP-dependent DNA ligase
MKIAQGQRPPFFKIRGKMIDIRYPCYVEWKLDGEANVYHNGALINKSSGKTRTDCPITDFLSNVFDHNTVLFGELYWEDGKAGRLYDLLSHAKDDKLKFSVFDVIHPEVVNLGYQERREWLVNNWTQAHDQVGLIPAFYCETPDEVEAQVGDSKVLGYEGVVVKNADSRLILAGRLIPQQLGWVKRKHIETVDVPITHIDDMLERMEIEHNGRKVGVKLNNKYKQGVKVGDVVEVEHQGVLNGGGLRHPVYRGKKITRRTK